MKNATKLIELHDNLIEILEGIEFYENQRNDHYNNIDQFPKEFQNVIKEEKANIDNCNFQIRTLTIEYQSKLELLTKLR